MLEGADEAVRRLNQIGQRVNIVLKEIAPVVRDFIVENIKNGDHKPNSPLTKRVKGSSKPLLDTGQLRGSITYVINKKDELKVGSNLVYAPVHQFGATITPKVAKKLTLPATRKIKKLTKAKGVKGTLSMLEGMGYRVVSLEKSVLAVPPKGIKAGRYGLVVKGKNAEVVYIRKDKVVIPARPFLYLDEAQVKFIRQRIIEILRSGYYA